MMEKYIHEWEERSTLFLSSHIPGITGHLRQLSSMIIPTADTFQNQITLDLSAFTPDHISKLLHGLATLAREPYLLHIQQPNTLLWIHCTLWSICTLPVFYQIAHKWTAYQQLTKQLPKMSLLLQHNSSMMKHTSPAFTLEDLRRCFATGSKLLSFLKSNSSSNIIPSSLTELLELQLRALQIVIKYIQDAWDSLTQCNNPSEMREKGYFPLLESFQSLVNIKKSFVNAKLHSFYHHKASIDVRKSEKIDNNVASGVISKPDDLISAPIALAADINIVEVQQEETTPLEVYCWCRSSSIEGDMICCDECEEWFHYACVGIPKVKKSRPRSSASKTIQAENVATAESIPANCEAPAAKQTADSATKQRGKKRKKEEAVDVQSLEHYFCIGCSMLKNGTYVYAW
jgi:hypothetical protein